MATYYVKWDSPGPTRNGLSWDTAYTTISSAILAHTATGDVIEVSGGRDGHIYNEAVDFRYGGAAQIIGSSQAGHDGRVSITNSGINAATLNITNKTVKNIDILNAYSGRAALTSQGGTLESVNMPSGLRAFLHNSGTTIFDKCNIENQSDTSRTGTVIAGVVTFRRSTVRKCASTIQVENGATLNIERSDIVENYGSTTINLTATATANIKDSAISANGKVDSNNPVVVNNLGGTLNVTNSLLQPHYFYNTPCCSNMTVDSGNITSSPHFVSHTGGKAYVSLGADCDCRDLGTGQHLPGEGTWDGFQALIDYANPKGIYCYVAMERINRYTQTDWDRIRAWEAAGNEAHNHTFFHDGMVDVLSVGVLVVTGPVGSSASLTINRVDDTNSNTWTGSFVMQESGVVVSTIDIGRGASVGDSPYNLRAEIIKRAGWTAEPPVGKEMNYERPIVSLMAFAEQSTAAGITLKGDIDAYMWMDYVEPKLLIEKELGHECNFCTYPGGQSTSEGEAWILNPANFKGLTTPYLGGRKAYHTSGSYTWRDPRFTSGTVAKIGCQVGQINAPYLPAFIALEEDIGDKADAHLCWLASIGGITMYYIHSFEDIAESKVREFVDAIAANPAAECMLPRDLIQLIRTEDDLDGDGLRFGSIVIQDEADFHLRIDSPCLGSGTKIPGVNTDIEGNPLFPPYNIGPYGLSEGALGVAPVVKDGPPRNNITRLTGEAAVIDPAGTYKFADTNAWRVVTGWTAGTANDFFDADGLPLSFTGQQLINSGVGYQLYYGQKGIAGYTIEQDAKSHKKIVKFLRVNTYIDSILYDPDQDYNW